MVVQARNDGAACGVEAELIVRGGQGAGDLHDTAFVAPDVQRSVAVDFGVGDQQPFVP